MILKWGLYGGIIGFIGMGIMSINSIGFSQVIANGFGEFIKTCAVMGVAGFCIGAVLSRWIMRHF
ncbi:hypothetical protein SAMN04490178_1424 [Propionispora vibrioides]|uniref:Uncharacterized protein n=1 Tax=Propionispora vibrioides TaxID=112903 RepID=A0A1H8Y3T7_9FIRM|nr:hypothetical protein SAMN04490178_1424 [Propionispora vibrioides]